MLQQTLQRLEGVNTEPPIMLCNKEHRYIVVEQLRQLEIEEAKIILEPIGRNTAPAIAIAAMQAQAIEESALILVLAADHLIEDVSAFHQAIKQAEESAKLGNLTTFGIIPTGPETAYGYIQMEEGVDSQTIQAQPVARFVEKPDSQTAQSYLEQGNYLWNSGMFLMSATQYLEQLQRYREDIYQVCQKAYQEIEQQYEFQLLPKETFSACPSESIDYAVMEQAEDVTVVALDAGWNDIGSWSALWAVNNKDDEGNSTKGDVLLHDTHNSLIHAESGVVATVGVENLVVIETKDAILISQKDRSQDVKAIVDQLKANKRSESQHHRVIYRPWGYFDSIEMGERFKVKRITVKPGEKLSLQKHYHRAEHWIVVSGTAKVIHNDKETIISENESTYIHIGETHALENPGQIPLELIEVQTGSYLGEDDIVRLDDNYGRSENCEK